MVLSFTIMSITWGVPHLGGKTLQVPHCSFNSGSKYGTKICRWQNAGNIKAKKKRYDDKKLSQIVPGTLRIIIHIWLIEPIIDVY